MKKHPMIHTLVSIKGNAKACVYTEPLWGIPFNLYNPYLAIYMLALGLTDEMIGLIATLSTISQLIFSVLGGMITDKLGRRLTTFIFDIISWGVPAFIWMIAKDFKYFALAAIINGVLRVTAISWNSLMVEDTPKDQLVPIYTWVYIAALGTGFFSPLAGFAIERYSLIPTMRVIFAITFVMMMVKFIVLYFTSTETETGRQRMEATKNESLFSQLRGYGGVIRHILSNKSTMFLLWIMLVMHIQYMIFGNFWSINAVDRVGVPMLWISIFPMLKSIIFLLFYFFIMPKISVERYKIPLELALLVLAGASFLMVVASGASMYLVIISVIGEAASLALLKPLIDSLQVTLVDKVERARIIGVLYTVILLVSSPFGWISGILSGIDRRLPFTLMTVLLLATFIWARFQKEQEEA